MTDRFTANLPEEANNTRLAVVCFSVIRGGMELDALRMHYRLRSEFNSLLICRKDSFLEAEVSGQKALASSCVALKFWAWFALKFFSLGLAHQMRRALVQNKITDIIFFGTSEMRSIALAVNGLPIRVHLRQGTTVHKEKFGLVRGFGYRRVNTYLATSEHIAKNIKNFFPNASDSNLRVLYPVVNISQTDGINVEDLKNPVVIKYHSRFVPGKGQLDALHAFKALGQRNQNVQLHLVGDFSDSLYVSEIRKDTANSGLQSRCRIENHTDDISAFLAGGGIFLAPSYGEGFSNSFVEAMQAGLVCIVYRNTVFPEFQRQGFYFHAVETGDKEALAAKLIEVVSSLSQEIAKSAPNMTLAREKFSAHCERETLRKLFNGR
jgi:glycosyltransferase involved in cell wall biosynthesis